MPPTVVRFRLNCGFPFIIIFILPFLRKLTFEAPLFLLTIFSTQRVSSTILASVALLVPPVGYLHRTLGLYATS